MEKIANIFKISNLFNCSATQECDIGLLMLFLQEIDLGKLTKFLIKCKQTPEVITKIIPIWLHHGMVLQMQKTLHISA